MSLFKPFRQQPNQPPSFKSHIISNDNPAPPVQFNKSAYPENQRQFYPNRQNYGLGVVRRSSSIRSSDGYKVPQPLRSSMKYHGQKASHSNQTNTNQPLATIVEANTTIIKSIFSLGICKLCQCPAQQLLSISNCEHKFCVNCLNQYVKYKIGMLEPVLCPQEECQKQMDQHGRFFHDLPEQLQQKYRNQKLWLQTKNNPDVRLCPRQNCNDGLVDLLKQPPICNKCGKTFCKECELEAHEGPCQKAFQEKFTDWKRCPKCNVFIQRTEGCNHMTCRCGHEFCYVCLSKWEQKHYGCGGQGIEGFIYNDDFQVPQNLCVRILYLIFYIILFPFLLIVSVLVLVFCLVLGAIAGFFVFPCAVLCSGNQQIIGVCCLILCPILGVIGFIFGTLMGGFLFIAILCPLFCGRYFSRVGKLCGCENQQIIDQDVSDYSDY